MLLTDENMRPIAVQIPYKEWLEIESLIGSPKKKKTNISKLAGTIKLSEDPVKFQRKLRDEWL